MRIFTCGQAFYKLFVRGLFLGSTKPRCCFFTVFLASIKKRTGKISRIQGKAHLTGVKLKNLQYLRSIHNNDGNHLFINQTAKEKFHHDVYHQDIILSVKGKIANVISFLCI